ncbi:MAG: hypothetical protein QNJ45_12530, partial [Ardenticatenaceae bacterium]|nr:hypothetical protein [Ardenticatenaceae bacterium]
MVIHLLASSKTALMTASPDEMIAALAETGGRGNPSAETAKDTSNSGRSVVRVINQDLSGKDPFSSKRPILLELLKINMAFILQTTLSISCQVEPALSTRVHCKDMVAPG